MPSSWFFAIHEDTPEEEAENLMEHSTLTLDLSSDDESATKANEDRGKENVAPEDYSPAAASSPTRRSRRSPKSSADMDTDEAARAPLGHLDTAEFIPEGLTKDSIIIIHETPEACASEASVADDQVKSAMPIIVSQHKDIGIADVVSKKGDIMGEIFIFEDESASPAVSTGGKRKRSADDEDDE